MNTLITNRHSAGLINVSNEPPVRKKPYNIKLTQKALSTDFDRVETNNRSSHQPFARHPLLTINQRSYKQDSLARLDSEIGRCWLLN